MFLHQYFLSCLAHASYLIGDEGSGTAVVVDPQRDVEGYIEDAAKAGLAIRHVVLTHFHADFIAGHLELRDKLGAEIHLGARADAEYAFSPLADGQTLELGDLRLQALETPGHTPEAICLLVYDRAQDADKPHAVLTGDTLFIGDVGRPDLMASAGVTAEELAGMLYDSLHQKLLPLPDDTLVYPAHGAGSLCGKNLSSDTFSTMGVQRAYNHTLQPMGKNEFIELVTSDLPPAPSYFAYDAMLNRQEHPTLDRAMAEGLKPLTLDDVSQAREQGAQTLDVRDPADYAGAHLDGSINIGLGGSFASWAGQVLSRESPIILIADSGREAEAALRLGRIGFDHVAGYLTDGMAALAARPGLVSQTERITAATLAERLGSPSGPLVLDVRAPAEWAGGHIKGSVNIELNDLDERAGELPTGRDIVVHCASGYRSSIGASVLERHGVAGIMELVGGFQAWEATKLETVIGAP